MSSRSSQSSNAWRHPLFILYVVLSLFGIAVLLWSAQHWYALQAGMAKGPSFCNFGAYWNCDRVALSPYSAVAGIPIGIFGAAWFFLLGVLVMTRSIPRWVILSGFGVAWLLCFALAYVLLIQLQLGCLVCYMGYVAWFGAGVCCFFMPLWRPLNLKLAVFAVAVGWTLLGMGQMGLAQTYSLNHSPDEIREYRKYIRSLPAERVTIESPLSKGVEGGRIHVVEFSDFSCPFCAEAAFGLVPQLLNEPDLTFTFIPYPQDGACHPGVPDHIQRGTCRISEAALCADEQGRFWSFHDVVFEHLIETNRLISLAQAVDKAGIDADTLEACLESGRMEVLLSEMIEAAIDLNVRGTPTFFINGRRIPGNLPLPLFRIAIEELRKLDP